MKVKHTLLTVIALVLAVAVQAQVADLHEYAQGRAVTKSYSPMFIGCDGSRIAFIEFSGRMKNKVELATYDMNQKELARTLVTEDKEMRCYGGFINGSHIDLLMVHWKGEDMHVFRERRDLATLKPEGEPLVLADYHGTKGDKMSFSLGSSANNELLATTYVVARETQDAEVQVALYSRELEEYWKMDSRCRKFNMIHVTDSGEVLLGNTNTGEGKFYISILDGETEVSHSFEIGMKRMAESSIARYVDGKIYVLASHMGKENLMEMGIQSDYYVSACYDTRRKTVTTDRHDITKTEYNRLNNYKDDKKVKKDDYRIIFFNMDQVVADKDGYYAVFDQSWTTSVNGVPESKNRTGNIVVRINNEGKIEWTKTFHMASYTEYESQSMINYHWVPTERGLMLVWVRNKKDSTYPAEKPVNMFQPFKSAGVLGVMLIDRKGETTLQDFPLPAKNALMGKPHRMDNGEWLLVIRGMSKGHLATMKLK